MLEDIEEVAGIESGEGATGTSQCVAIGNSGGRVTLDGILEDIEEVAGIEIGEGCLGDRYWPAIGRNEGAVGWRCGGCACCVIMGRSEGCIGSEIGCVGRRGHDIMSTRDKSNTVLYFNATMVQKTR